MPWESFLLKFATTYSATKLLDSVLFSDDLKPSLFFKGFAEKFQSLDSNELLIFYNKETPLCIELIGMRYFLPMSVVADSRKVKMMTCVKDDKFYSISPSLEDYSKPIINRCNSNSMLYDGRIVRVKGLKDNILTLQRASYYDAVATNFSIDHKPKQRKETLREFLHYRDSKFKSFENSLLVNHLGIGCLIETIDGKIIIQKRSGNVVCRSNTLSLSVSGAVDWDDLEVNKATFSISQLIKTVIRETFEELHIEVNEITPLGIMREFLRGGKPEMYFFGKCNLPFGRVREQLRSAKDKSELKGLIGYEFHSNRIDTSELSKDAFKSRVKKILEDVGVNANLTLIAGIILTSKFLLENVKSYESK